MSTNQTSSNTRTTARGATADEVAARFRVTPASVRKWARAGRIPSFRLGTVYRFDLDAVEAAIRNDRKVTSDG